MRVLAVFLMVAGLTSAQQNNKKTDPLDGSTVRPNPGEGGYSIQTKTGSSTLQPRGNGQYQINTGSDSYTVKPRPGVDGSYRVQNDRTGETYTMKPRGDGTYSVENDNPQKWRNKNSNVEVEDEASSIPSRRSPPTPRDPGSVPVGDDFGLTVPGPWGAIAYSKTDQGFGFSTGRRDLTEAKQLAMSYCSAYGRSCRLWIWYANSCGAIAQGGKAVGWGTADLKSDAETRAMEECKKAKGTNCTVKVSKCSP